jgi:hypothetical protein
MSGADTIDSATPVPATMSSPASDAPAAQQAGFVTPRTYLTQTRPIVPPKLLATIDIEQMEGLVRLGRLRD